MLFTWNSILCQYVTFNKKYIFKNNFKIIYLKHKILFMKKGTIKRFIFCNNIERIIFLEYLKIPLRRKMATLLSTTSMQINLVTVNQKKKADLLEIFNLKMFKKNILFFIYKNKSYYVGTTKILFLYLLLSVTNYNSC